MRPIDAGAFVLEPQVAAHADEDVLRSVPDNEVLMYRDIGPLFPAGPTARPAAQ